MARKSDPKHVKDLRPDPQNARSHPERNVGMIADSLREVGAARSIVLDEHNVVLAGNGLIEGAKAAGITKVKVIDADGDTIIAVRRSNLTPEQKTRLALFDNRSAEMAEWNPDVLRELAEGGTVLADLFSSDELGALLATEEAADVEGVTVAQPVAVAWVLVGIPLGEWPKHQAAVESLQGAALFTSMVLRPVETEKEAKAKK